MGKSNQPIYQVPLFSRICRTLFKPLFRGLFFTLASIKISGVENIPFKQPYIATFNHVSMYDPPFIVSCWPEMLEIMGASVVWEKPFEGTLARMYHGIQVHRGEYDRVVFDKVLSVLESGRPLLMSPEGGRTHITALRRAKPGLAFIVERAGVPVVPVGLVGTTGDFFAQLRDGRRPKLEMHIGKPIHLPTLTGTGEERRESRQLNADLVMQHIAGLLPENYRGVYTENAILPD
jgi:1-acyl-sn-glycerol-3-phosphate acyltransferase